MKQKFEFSLDEANPFAVVSFSSSSSQMVVGGKCPIRNLLYEGGTFFIPRRLLFPSPPLGASFNSPSRLFFALTDSRTECSSSSSSEAAAAPSYPPLHHRRYPLGEINFFICPLQRFLLPIKFYSPRVSCANFHQIQGGTQEVREDF